MEKLDNKRGGGGGGEIELNVKTFKAVIHKEQKKNYISATANCEGKEQSSQGALLVFYYASMNTSRVCLVYLFPSASDTIG